MRKVILVLPLHGLAVLEADFAPIHRDFLGELGIKAGEHGQLLRRHLLVAQLLIANLLLYELIGAIDQQLGRRGQVRVLIFAMDDEAHLDFVLDDAAFLGDAVEPDRPPGAALFDYLVHGRPFTSR